MSQIPDYDSIRQGDIQGEDRRSISKDLKALVTLGFLRRDTMFSSAYGKGLFRRVKG